MSTGCVVITVVSRVAALVALAAIGCGGSVCSIADAQGNDPAAVTPLAATLVEDEVVVSGQRPAQLRAEIALAEQAFYERFNAINSSDEFDIACRDAVFLGSKISQRICEPKFARAADANLSAGTVRGLQGSSSPGIPQQFVGLKQVKHGQLQQELRRLATEDAQLLEALTRLVTLKQEYESVGKD